MRIYHVTAIALLISPIFGYAADTPTLDGDDARIGYSLGYQIGGDFKRQGITLDREAVLKGIQDALGESAPLMSSEEMNATLIELKRKIVARQQTQLNELKIKNAELDKALLKENAGKRGVVTTKSGLQYRIITKGSGKAPVATDHVTVNYRGSLSNGHEFDSSSDHGGPATFQLDQVIKGWTEGLQLIKEGGKIQLVIPPELAYASGPLEKRVLLFDVELISVDKKEPPVVEHAATPAS